MHPQLIKIIVIIQSLSNAWVKFILKKLKLMYIQNILHFASLNVNVRWSLFPAGPTMKVRRRPNIARGCKKCPVVYLVQKISILFCPTLVPYAIIPAVFLRGTTLYVDIFTILFISILQ